MNYTMTNSGTPVVQECDTLKDLMRQTYEELTEATERAERILAEISGAYPRKDEEPQPCETFLDSERINRGLAVRLCSTLQEIALGMGIGH